MTEEAPSEPRTLTLEALKALAHPLRVQIFSALSSYGPATASALAVRLGESSGATSYHLRQLERHGFVREDISRGNGRDRWWERTPGPIEITDPESAETAAGRAAGELLEAEFQRVEDQRYTDYRRAAGRLEPEWRAAAQASGVHLQLNASELRAFGREYTALIDRYRGRPADEDGRRRVEITLRGFPVVDPNRDPPA